MWSPSPPHTLRRPRTSLRLAALLFLVPLTPAAAQTFAVFELSYSNPGARSLGFGGAFVALADDATAAFANPAGLTQLIEPEISIEGRAWSYSTPYFERGRYEGQPTGLGIDTSSGLESAVSDDDLAGLSFLSFVYPRKRWAFAVYRHQLASFEFTSEVQGFFGNGSTAAGSRRSSISTGDLDLDLVTYGMAGGYEVSESLSLGLGLTYFNAHQRIDQGLYLWDEDTLEGFFGETSFLPERTVLTSARLIDEGDWGLAAGLLWHLTERWHLGASFRQGPEFEDRVVIHGGPEVERLFPGNPPDTVIEFSSPYAFPDVYGLGLAFRSQGGRLTVSGEWDRVEYSALFENDPDENEFIEDADEFHLGVEVAVTESTPLLAFRLGTWLETPHRLRNFSDDALSRQLFPPGDDELHYALGLGVVFERVQIDLGADFSDPRDTVALSAIYSF